MAGILGEADIFAMLTDLAEADSAVGVTLGATTVTGLFDRAAVQFFDGEMPTMIADGEAVHIKAGSLPGVEAGDEIDVAGTTYFVRNVMSYGDGAMQRIGLTAGS